MTRYTLARTILGVVAAASLAACSGGAAKSGDPPTSPALIAQNGQPYIVGRITQLSTDGWGWRVDRTGASQPGQEPAAFFRLSHDSRLVRGNGSAATTADLKAGTEVSVWIDPGSAVLESFPVQIVAKVVQVHD